MNKDLKDEYIPVPWRKYRSNKGNWYYYNPETQVSVWDLQEYLSGPKSKSSKEEESEFSVKKYKEEEIILDSSYVNYYDDIFNECSNEEEEEKGELDKQIEKHTTTPEVPKPINATSSKRFGSRKGTSAPGLEIGLDLHQGQSKKIICLKNPHEVKQPSIVNVQSKKTSSNPLEKKKKPNPFEFLKFDDIFNMFSREQIPAQICRNDSNSFSFPEFLGLQESVPSFTFSNIEHVKKIRKSRNNNLFEYLPLADPLFGEYSQSPARIIENARYLQSILI